MKNLGVVSRLDRLVADTLQRSGYSGREVSLVIAVSGGPDSSALLYSLHRLGGLNLHVAHLNHDIRGEESDRDARFVADLARSLDLPATIEKEDPVAYQRRRRVSSFEQATREMRYSFLYRVAREQDAPAVAVGHTTDDQAETVLEHLLRGSGLRGLKGMSQVSPWPWPPGADGVVVIRPLLTATKRETEAYCRELGRDFRRDSDNDLPKFTRNRVRRDLLPWLAAEYNPRVTDALVRLSRTVALDLDYLEREGERLWNVIASEIASEVASEVASEQVDEGADGRAFKIIRFDRLGMAALHPAMQRQLLRKGLVQLVGDARRLEESHLSTFSMILQQRKSGFRVGLPRGLWLHVTYDAIILSECARLPCPLPAIEGQHGIEFPSQLETATETRVGNWRIKAELITEYHPQDPMRQDGLTAYFDAASLKKGIWVRTRQPGDRFQPLGMNVEKRLQNFFIDSKVPGDWRDRVPLLMSGQHIAWVVGHRIAEWAKVEAGAANGFSVLRVEFTR
jgi:tRNA(Ile)-lysidine synthase